MSIVTGLLKGLRRDSRLVEETDYKNGYVRQLYEYAGERHQVDFFEGKAHCVINKTAGVQYTRSGKQLFKDGQ